MTPGKPEGILEAVQTGLKEFSKKRELGDLRSTINSCLPPDSGNRDLAYQTLGTLLHECAGTDVAFNVAAGLFSAAAGLMNIGRSPEAEEAIVTSLGFFSETNRVDYELRARNALAILNIRAGKTLKAVKMYDESLEIATRNGMEQERARLLFSLGDFYRENDSKECLPYLKDTIELCGKVGNETGLAYAYSSLSRYERKTGDTAMALKHAEEALEHATASRMPVERAYFLLYYSMILHDTGNDSDALAALDEAEELLDPVAWKVNYISVMSQKMLILISSGEQNEARNVLERLHGNLSAEDAAYNDNGIYHDVMYRISMNMDEYEKALKFLERKEEIKEDRRRKKRDNLIAVVHETRKLEYSRREKNLLTAKKALLEQSNEKLNAAIEEIEVLQGMFPVCASCGKIRNEEGYWTQLRDYMARHLKTSFKETLCEECRAGLGDDFREETGS